MKKRKTRRVEMALHSITILILFIKTADLLKKGLFFPGCIILMIAFTALAILCFRRSFSIRARHSGIICLYLEAPALLVIAYTLHLEGKELLPYLFFLASIIYPVSGFIASKKFKQIRKPPLKRRLY